MAAYRKISVAVVNVALARQAGRKPTPDDYRDLIRALYRAKQPIHVWGERAVFIQALYTPAGQTYATGVLASFTKLRLDDDWLNTSTGELATESDLASVSIPPHLLPHFRRYNFRFDLQDHKLAVETLSEPASNHDRTSLSPGLVERYLEQMVELPAIEQKFGAVGITVLPSKATIAKILNWKHANKIELRIRPPNADDDDLEAEIEKRMDEEGAARSERTITAKRNQPLKPSAYTKAEMRVAARNGFVKVEGIEKGEKKSMSTQDRPLIETGMYDPDVQDHVSAFEFVASAALAHAMDKDAGN